MVECIKFSPELKYTQNDLKQHLPEIALPDLSEDARIEFDGTVGSGQRLMDKCAFCRHCMENAATLSEPEWYAYITNMSLTRDGGEFVHEVSKPYPKYSKTETDDKIRHAVKEKKPHTCEYIKTRLGFEGCNTCTVKAPIAHAVLSMAEQAAELADGDVSADIIFDDRTIELARIAGYLHDIGNLVNRVDHSQSGAVMAFRILDKLGMPADEIATVVTAIGNHDEGTGVPVNPVAAALIIADKSDVRRTRVRNSAPEAFDIHDRVNYSVERSSLSISEDKKRAVLELTIDHEIGSVMDYFEIFIGRMQMCKLAARSLGLEFTLFINGQKLL